MHCVWILLLLCSYAHAGDTSEAIRIRLSKPSFYWVSSGCAYPSTGPTCISIYEDNVDSPGWTDNCLCSTSVDLTTWRYTYTGQTWTGMRWVRLREPGLPSTHDNYLYMPNGGDWGYVFGYNGAIPNLDTNADCVLMYDASTPSTDNNYFCWYPLGETKYNVPSIARYVGTFNAGTSVYSFYSAWLIYYYITSSNASVVNGPYILPNVLTKGYAATTACISGNKIVSYTTLYGDLTFQIALLDGNMWQLPTVLPTAIDREFNLVCAGDYLAFVTATSAQVSVMYNAPGSGTYTYNTATSGTPSCYTTNNSQPTAIMCTYPGASGVYYLTLACGFTSTWACTFTGAPTLIVSAVAPQHVVAAGSQNNYAISYMSSGNITVISSNATGVPSSLGNRHTRSIVTGTLVHTLALDTSGPYASISAIVYLLDMITPASLVRCRMYVGVSDTLTCASLDMGISAGYYFIYTADPRVQSCTSPYTTTYCGNIADHTDRTLRAQYSSINYLVSMITTQLGGKYAGTIINGGIVVNGSSTWLNLFWGIYMPLLIQPAYPNLGVDDLSGSPGFSHTNILRYLEDKDIYGRDMGPPVKADDGNTFTYTYSGSMAYYVSVSGYMVLNMHAKPTPTGIITDDGAATYTIRDKMVASYTVYRYNLTASLPWLSAHLNRANSSNLRVVVNIHQYPTSGEWDSTAFNVLLLTYQDVVAAVFSGYSLTRSCEYGKIPGTRIPVIHVGSRDQQTYLVVRLSQGEMETVSIRNSITGGTAINTSPTGSCTTYSP